MHRRTLFKRLLALLAAGLLPRPVSPIDARLQAYWEAQFSGRDLRSPIATSDGMIYVAIPTAR